MIKLRGMTWNHARGYDPMVATSRAWFEKTGVQIDWEKRSLQDFEAYPVEDLARAFDLIVIDHPHVGEITAENCLVPLDVSGRQTELAALALGSVGQSFASYQFAERQWAFPIDAAAQVMAWRPDLCEPPQCWDDVIALARQGRIVLPLRPPHNLMCFFTLCANLGAPCATTPGKLVQSDIGLRAIAMLQETALHLDAANFDMDPIAASELLVQDQSTLAVMPLGYGYANYTVPGFRRHRLRFADIPLAECKGSTLGGTGIAVSAFSEHVTEAIDYAYWVASGEVQASLYAVSGGQPGYATAWEADAVNAATDDFYAATRQTLERAYMRPRHRGYMGFQQKASDRLDAGLRSHHAAQSILADLNRLFEESF